MQDESIYNLIPKEYQAPEKVQRFVFFFFNHKSSLNGVKQFLLHDNFWTDLWK